MDEFDLHWPELRLKKAPDPKIDPELFCLMGTLAEAIAEKTSRPPHTMRACLSKMVKNDEVVPRPLHGWHHVYIFRAAARDLWNKFVPPPPPPPKIPTKNPDIVQLLEETESTLDAAQLQKEALKARLGAARDLREYNRRPSTRYRAVISRKEHEWIAFVPGWPKPTVVGRGGTPHEAMLDFDRAFMGVKP